ncbi:MAG: response regulator [Owenweeksia sp.]|nr:response regulator [Owenweeksia sp.]
MTKEEVEKVMLVDDNSTDRFIHTKLLNIYSIGKETLEFDTGRAALDYLRENKANKDLLPDIILLDVLMPEMNGFDFLVYMEQIYDELAKKPALYMSQLY